ncbi:MAG: sensor histidine kinase, partial [Ruthenibacterium sp.]
MWKNLKVKHKILCVFLPLISCSILVIMGVSAVLIVNSSRAKTLQNASDKLALVTRQLNATIEHLSYNVKAFSTSSTLQNSLSQQFSPDAYGRYLFSSTMTNSIHNIMDVNTFILDGYIQTYDNKIYNLPDGSLSFAPTPEQTALYGEIVSHGGKILLKCPSAAAQQNGSCITLQKSIIDVLSGRCLGVLVFELDEARFYEAYCDIAAPEDEFFYILDAEHTILSASDRNEIGKVFAAPTGSSLVTMQKSLDNFVLFQAPLKAIDYTVVYAVHSAKIYRDALMLIVIICGVGLLLLVLTLVFSVHLANSITRPLSALAYHIAQVGTGNLDTSILIDSTDEIGVLTTHFNDMVCNVRQLTTQVLEEETAKKDYELKLLQAQINPHFLYNCLDNIHALIDSGEPKTAASMLTHLGRYYRSILSKGRHIITMEEELQMVRDYLEIQLLKTPHLFTYTIEIPATLRACKIPKMLLQPVVENSILHGFTNYKDNRSICISICEQENDLCIRVRDDGRGIPPEKLKNLYSDFALSIPNHFGLKNIHDRIVLRYGASYGVRLSSVSEKETLVEIIFPKLL